MSEQSFQQLKNLIIHLPKSNILAGEANASGRYKFYLSGKKIGRIDVANPNKNAIIMGDGGVASIAFATGKYSYSSHNFGFYSNAEHLLTEYIFRALEQFLPVIDYKGFVGSSIKNIDKKFLFDLYVQTISFPEQRKIVSILSSVDEVIEATQRQIDKLQFLKNASMNELLTNGVGHTEFQDSKLGRIPKCWEVKRLGETAYFKRGHDLTKSRRIDGDFPVVSSSGITGWHNQGNSNAPNVVVGRKGSIGSVHFMETGFWAHDTSLYVIEFFDNCEKFIFYLATWLNLQRYGTKSGSPSLNRNDIHPIKIAVPPNLEQQKIVLILDSIEAKIRASFNKLRQTQSVKKSLMQDLLTGTVRVKVN